MPVNDEAEIFSSTEGTEVLSPEQRKTRSNTTGTTRTSFPQPRRRGNRRTPRDAPSKAKETFTELLKDHPDIKERTPGHLYCALCDCDIRVRSLNDYLTVSRHIAREKHQVNFAKRLVSIATAGARLVEDTSKNQGNIQAGQEVFENDKGIRIILQHASKTLEDFDLPWRRTIRIHTENDTLEDLINVAYKKLEEDPNLTQITAVFLEDFQSFIYDDGDLKALKDNDTLVFKFEPIAN